MAKPAETDDAETLAGSQPRPVGEGLDRTAPLASGAGAVLPRGTALDDTFVVEELLGQGAMGAVYLVTHRALGKEFAAKVLARAGGIDAAAVTRLRNEARMASAIDHENIVNVSHLGTLADGSVFVVMERLRGEDLRARLLRQREADHPWLPDAEVRGLVPPLLGALASAHAAGIVHRDLKPENVFLHHRRGRITPKLVDFGIGKLRDPSQDLRLTATGQIVGTPLYMSPEQSRSSDLVDARSDLYTMGVVLFELLTGRLPFEASNLYEIVLKHVTEAAPDPRAFRPSLPAAVAELVTRCLRKAPEERFQTADELLEAWRAAWGEAGDAPLSSSYDGDAPPELATVEARVSSDPRRVATPTAPVPLAPSAAEAPLARHGAATVDHLGLGSTVAALPEAPTPGRATLPAAAKVAIALVALGLVAWLGLRPASDATPTAPVANEPAASTPMEPSEPSEPIPTDPETAAETREGMDGPALDAEEPSGEDPVTTLSRRLESTPTGASVFRDGAEIGVTPLSLELPAGEGVTFELRRRGFETETIVLGADSPALTRISLRRARRGSSAFPALAPR